MRGQFLNPKEFVMKQASKLGAQRPLAKAKASRCNGHWHNGLEAQIKETLMLSESLIRPTLAPNLLEAFTVFCRPENGVRNQSSQPSSVWKRQNSV
jgi:hypothetical protein